MNQILISIIIPTYNRCTLLEMAINSVLIQTYPHFQLIIIDDGSIDSTRDVVIKYKNDTRIEYIKNNTNQGTMFSLHEGILRAKGDFSCFLGDDDELTIDALKTVVKTIVTLNNPELGMIRYNIRNKEDGKISGSGLMQNGYVSYEQLICKEIGGDHWVVFNQRLLSNDMDYTKFYGAEIFYWTDIQKISRCYFCKKAVYIAKRDHGPRLTSSIATSTKIEKYLFTRYMYYKRYSKDLFQYCPLQYWHYSSDIGLYLFLIGEVNNGSIILRDSMKACFNIRTLSFYLFGRLMLPIINIIYYKFDINKILLKCSNIIYCLI